MSETPATKNPMPTLHPTFYDSPALNHLRMGALSAATAPDAVLHSVLARIAAFTPHDLLLPPLVGGETPLNYFAAIVAPSGGGKSTAAKAAARLLPAPAHLEGRDDLQIGTGEGLVESFLEKDPDTKDKIQVHHNLYLYVDEGEIMRRYGQRDGTTLDVVIRTAHSGGALGQANAHKDNTRRLPANSYALGLVVGFQPQKAGALLTPEAIDGGTPQRFAWAAGQMHEGDLTQIISHLDGTPPPWPGHLPIKPAIWNRSGIVVLSDEVKANIRRTHLELLAGVEDPPPALDAHAGLIQLRIATLLALLEGRFNPTARHHDKAAQVWRATQALRKWVRKQVQSAEETEEQRRLSADVKRATAQAIARSRAEDEARRLRSSVLGQLERKGPQTLGVLTNSITKSLRPLLSGTLRELASEGSLVIEPMGTTVRLSLPADDDLTIDLGSL